MEKAYVDQHDNGYWVAGTRVSLDSIVTAFNQGLSADSIATDCFPTLTLEQVYGAITYYLAHRVEIDEYLKQTEVAYEQFREANHLANAELLNKLREVRRRRLSAQS